MPTKKTSRKKQPAKPNRRTRTRHKVAPGLEEASAVARNALKIAGAMAPVAHKAGKHEARAELVAPTLRLMAKTAAMETSPGGMVIYNTDCALLLACLAEAGYRPQADSKADRVDAMFFGVDPGGRWSPVTDFAGQHGNMVRQGRDAADTTKAGQVEKAA